MSTHDELRAAKARFLEMYKGRPWCIGAGIGKDCIQVYANQQVDTSEVKDMTTFEGVVVKVVLAEPPTVY